MPTRPPGTPDVDLTFDGANGTINGAVFMTGQYQQVPDQFFSFLEIRHNGTEQGYNTNGSLQFDERDVQNATHSILLANVPIVVGDGSHGTQEGVAYREFRLNIGEAGNAGQYLSLDALQIYQEESGNLTNFTAGSGFAGAHTNYLAYNLDAGADRWIGLKEGANGNGAVQTEFTILIPDSYFINDPSHRYVTLYSEFGMQAGWTADSSSEIWGLGVNSTGPTPAMTVHKTATVPGDTADTAGEVISYAITVANVGDVALTGLTVTDPSVSNLAPVLSGGFNVGDTNHDNQLSVGETWQYTASHTVTQSDLDTDGGGDGVIDNTVTADSAQTTPVTATASVEVERNTSVDLVKTADVSSVDAAGDVITHTITVTNTGIVTLTNVQVDDSDVTITTPIYDFNAPILGPELLAPVFDGDYNVGDTNQNGFEDPGETFVFANPGDTNQNGVQDPGETFFYTNVGDTNQNGSQDTGEIFQYYNAGDTNHDGDQEAGETFQFDVSHAATPVDANHDGFNDGDTNHDGQLNAGETWQYTASYTVTQDDIDNGQVVDPALTHDNTASVTNDQNATDEQTVSVSIIQNPHVLLTKSAAVADGAADEAGDVINYTITVQNDGNMTLTTPVVSDSPVDNLAFASGDTDNDGKIDVGETWVYTASHIVTQDEIDNSGVVDPLLSYDNTASVTTHEGASSSDSASVTIVQNPHVTLVKAGSVADGTANAVDDVINYTIDVTNDGNMTLTTPVVSDPSVSGLAYASGDADNDGKLDLGETWRYTASHNLTQADIDNGGMVDPGLTYDNTASVSTDQGASDSDSVSIPVVQDPSVTLAKSATVADGTADAAGDVINYTIGVTNDGNMTLTNPMVSDPFVSNLAEVLDGSFNAGDTDQDGNLSVGETWQYTANHTVTQAEIEAGGSISNTASVSTDQGASDSDTASVTVVSPPPNASVSVVKSALGYHDLNSNNVADAGDTVEYGFNVSNTGNITLHNVGVSDVGGDTAVTGGTIATLGVGTSDTTTWHAFYTIQPGETQHDNDAVVVTDEASDSSGTVHVVFADLILLV